MTGRAALTEFRPPPKDEEGHSLLSGPNENTQGTAAGTQQPDKAKQRVVEGSLDGEIDGTQQVAEREAEEDDTDAGSDGPWMPYLKPNMTISMVQMFDTLNTKNLLPHMDTTLQVSQNREKYYPLICFQEFWTLKVLPRCLLP